MPTKETVRYIANRVFEQGDVIAIILTIITATGSIIWNNQIINSIQINEANARAIEDRVRWDARAAEDRERWERGLGSAERERRLIEREGAHLLGERQAKIEGIVFVIAEGEGGD